MISYEFIFPSCCTIIVMQIMHTSGTRTARSQELLHGRSCPILKELDTFPVSTMYSGTFASSQGETRNIRILSMDAGVYLYTCTRCTHVAYIEQPSWKVIISDHSDFLMYSCGTWAIDSKWSLSVYTQWPPGQSATCLFWTKGSAQKTRWPRECSNAGPEDCKSRVLSVWQNKFNMPKRNINHHPFSNSSNLM